MLAPKYERIIMTRLALFALLVSLTALAHAGTFELSDPANEMLQEQNEPPEKQHFASEPNQVFEWSATMICSVEMSNGACTCIDKKKAKKLSMSQQECADRVLQALMTSDSR